jgi:hypothetical protein
MDPQACWHELVELMREYHAIDDIWIQEVLIEDILERLNALYDWLQKGGDVPTA